MHTAALIVARHPLYPLGHLSKGFSFLLFLWQSMIFHSDSFGAGAGDQTADLRNTSPTLPLTGKSKQLIFWLFKQSRNVIE